MRLNRALAMAGVCSRRQADELIRQGRVTVDGKKVDDLGRKVVPHRQEITVDGRRVDTAKSDEQRIVLALNKPRGIISTMDDPHGAPCLAGLIPSRYGRLFPVGRLDRDSQGLLLMTNDGDLAHRILHPSFEVEKVYHVSTDRPLTTRDTNALKNGEVELPGGERALPWEVDPLERSRAGYPRYRFVLKEGKKREIREVLDTLGYEVKRLKRVAIGPIDLGDPKVGDYRQLSVAEMNMLRDFLGLSRKAKASADRAARAPQKKPRADGSTSSRRGGGNAPGNGPGGPAGRGGGGGGASGRGGASAGGRRGPGASGRRGGRGGGS